MKRQTLRAPNLVALAITALLLAACKPSPDEIETLPGIIEFERLNVGALTAERVVDVLVEEGERVEVGTVLFRQDDTRLQAARGRLIAQRDQAAARLAEVRRGPRAEAIAADRASLAGAESELADAEADFERAEALLKQALGSQSTVDATRARVGRARSARDQASEQLRASVAGSTVEELDQARSALAAAEADLAANTVELSLLEVSAPVPGRIEAIVRREGEVPVPGSSVAVLLDERRPFVRVFIPEPLRGQLVAGTKLTVETDQGTSRGTVRWVSADPVFTPYYSLVGEDRSRLAYMAEIDLPEATDWIAGLNAWVHLADEGS